MGKNRNRKWKGFQRYLYKIILSHIFLILIPISILGVFWFSMISNQAEQKFHQQKSIELNEIVSGINQRIKAIKLEVATEIRDQKYSAYTFSGNYNSDLSMIFNRLSSMVEKYHLIDSVYFYDKITGKIYSSKSGKSAFSTFHDTAWLKQVNENSYSVQQLPLRYSMDNKELLTKYNTLYCEYNQLVLSQVLKGKPDFYLVANISISRLYTDIIDTYNLYNDHQEFFLLNSDGKLIEGECAYQKPEYLIHFPTSNINNGVTFVAQNGRIYYMKSLDSGIICVASYPLHDSFQESQYLGKYILLICIGLMIFLLMVSVYMAKRLYQPINTLYSDITGSTKNLQKDNIYDEIDMLKQVFFEMNTFNSNAKSKIMQFDEINKSFLFRSFLENSQDKQAFMKDHPYLFDESGNCLCEMLIIKFDIADMCLSADEEILFCLNLQEVLRTYLQSSMKGILTKIEEDNLVLLYRGNERESIDQTRNILTDTVIKLTNHNAYFGLSQPIEDVDKIISEYYLCRNLIQNAYFFNWKNEIITYDTIAKPKETDDIYNLMLNITTSFIRYIVSQKQSEITNLFCELETQLCKIKNASQVKDVCNRILVELDHEFHFTKSMNINLLQTLNENKTLTDMMNYSRHLLMQVSTQYGNNDAKENNYCELAKKYLNENYMKDMNITDTADHLNISYSYLSKIFRTRTGMTLTDYLNNIRIDKSKDYLTNTFLTLCEISEKVGYNNVQSYQRFFKKYINITPGDYRKLHTHKALENN